MQASKMVAGVLAIAVVGGAAYGLTKTSSLAATPDAVCRNQLLTLPEQSNCEQQMKAAKDKSAREQLASSYQMKVDARKNGDQSGGSMSSGGSTMTPQAPPASAAPGGMTAPTSPDANAPSSTAPSAK